MPSESHLETMNRITRRWRRHRWCRPTVLAALALLFVVGGVVVAYRRPGPGSDPADAHLRAARQALAQGRLDDAAAGLVEAGKQGGGSGEINRLWGVLYARAGRTDDALPLLWRAWDGDRDEGRGADPEVAEALARITMQRFQLADAIGVLDRWAREAPSDPRPLVMRAEIDRRIGEHRSVTIGHLREALRRDANCDPARLSLAELLYLESQPAEAGQHYAAYSARHPEDPAGHVGVGIVARVQGRTADAVAALDRALARDPDNTLALRERAAIDLHDGRGDAALSRLDRAVAVDPFDPELHYLKSAALDRLGRSEEAAVERRRSGVLRRDHAEMAQMATQLIDRPADNALRCRAARWMIEHGRADEAAQWARLVLRDQPDSPEANRLLADYHRRRGELGLANFYRLHAAPETAPSPAADHRAPGSSKPLSPPSGR